MVHGVSGLGVPYAPLALLGCRSCCLLAGWLWDIKGTSQEMIESTVGIPGVFLGLIFLRMRLPCDVAGCGGFGFGLMR